MKFDIDYKGKRIETLVTLLIFLLAIEVYYLLKHNDLLFWPLDCSLILILGFVIKKIGEFISLFWFRLTHYMGWINSKVILSFLYIVVFIPYGLINQLVSKSDVLNKSNKTSLFKKRNKQYKKEDFVNPW